MNSLYNNKLNGKTVDLFDADADLLNSSDNEDCRRKKENTGGSGVKLMLGRFEREQSPLPPH